MATEVLMHPCSAANEMSLNRFLELLAEPRIEPATDCPVGVLRGSVAKCLTRNPGTPVSSRTGSSVFFVVKPTKDMNNVSCSHGMTEIL